MANGGYFAAWFSPKEPRGRASVRATPFVPHGAARHALVFRSGWAIRCCAAVLALWLGIVVGCQSPGVKEKHFRRQERIRNVAGVYDLREKQSPDNLRMIAERYRTYEGSHGPAFEERLRWVAEHERERGRELKRQTPERHERIRTIFGGKPERIPDTWSDMVH